MKRLAVLLSVFLLVGALFGCSQDRSLAPDQNDNGAVSTSAQADPELIASELVARSGWHVESSGETGVKESGPDMAGSGGVIISMDREVIIGNVVHYSYQIKTGLGAYDMIGLHRVVKEASPENPIRTKRSIFLQHGDAVPFNKFMYGVVSPSIPDDQALAVFLAKNDVDVWGIDQSWTLVPMETTDFSFMADWGMQHNVDNLKIGIGIARIARRLTGNGLRKMHLLGYSSGVLTGYAYLNEESQRPFGLRQVAGFVQADCPYKTDFAPTQMLACAISADLEASIAAGDYVDPTGNLMLTLGMLGSVDPDSPSPVFPGLTNIQAALFLGSATHQLFPYTPWFHYTGGTFDEYGLPSGLQYTQVAGWLDFLMGAAPYEPIQYELDCMKIMCDGVDVPFDDFLGDITNPILNLCPAGGLGEVSVYTTTLLGSTDITTHIIQLYPPEGQMLDFGHIDLWTADNAEALVWAPMLQWIEEHDVTPGKGDKPKKKQI